MTEMKNILEEINADQILQIKGEANVKILQQKLLKMKNAGKKSRNK